MSLVHDRVAAVARAAAGIKAVGLDPYDNPLDRIAAASQILAELASRTDLFPARHYPAKTPGPSQFSSFYRLTEDADFGNAIYVSVCPGPFLNNHPHKHLHWTLIAGVAGTEHNVVFRREDDGSVPLRGRLREVERVAIRIGEVHHLHHQDYHTVAYDGTETAINIHAYGLGLDHPDAARRPGFLSPDSDTYMFGRPGPHVPWGVQSLDAGDVHEALTDGRAIATIAVELDPATVVGVVFDAVTSDRWDVRPPAGHPAEAPILLVGEAEPVEASAEQLARQGFPHLVRASLSTFLATVARS